MIFKRLLILVPLLVLLSGSWQFVQSVEDTAASEDTAAVSEPPETRYKQQVIAIFSTGRRIQDIDKAIVKAARFLYEKHDTISHVVRWNQKTQTFDRLKWNTKKETFDLDKSPEPLPIGPRSELDEKFFKWEDTRVQAVGHGDFSDPSREFMLGGATPTEIVDKITRKLSMGEDIGRMSIVGCTRDAVIGKPQDETVSERPGYMLTESFMKELKSKGLVKTEVSVRSALVNVDKNGRKLTGELSAVTVNKKGGDIDVEVGIEWSHKKSSNKYIGSFDSENGNEIKIKTDEAKAEVTSRFQGILPEDAGVYITDKPKGDGTRQTYMISDDDAFMWVDSIAQKTYDSIKAGSRALEKKYDVKFFETRQVKKQPVREINTIDDLLSEIKHFGETGVQKPTKKGAENAEYYRFGDWVLSMNRETFYVNLVGVVHDFPDIARAEKIKAAEEHFRNPKNSVPEDYPAMRPFTGEHNFFGDMKNWINGKHDSIGLERENAYNAQCGIAMFLSESIRSFHNHVTNMMALDLVNHGYLTRDYFFSSHPMGRGFTWQLEYDKAHPKKGKKKTGMDLLRDSQLRDNDLDLSGLKPRMVEIIMKSRQTIERISRISKTWLSHANTADLVMGSRNPPTDGAAIPFDVNSESLTSLEDIGSNTPHLVPGDPGFDVKKPPLSKKVYLRDYELKESSGRLLSTTISEPEIESVNTQVKEFAMTEDISSPLKASLALANDHVYVTNRIASAVELKEQQTGKKYEVLPESLDFEENGNSVRFHIQEEGNPSSQPVQISATIDKSKLASMELIENIQRESETLKQPSGTREGGVAQINRGLAIYGVVSGLAGSINALENGDIRQGAIGAAQSIHGLSDLAGYNQKLYKTAGKYLGKALRRGVESAGQSVSTIVGEEAGNLVRAGGGEILSTVGRVGELSEAIPFVGTAFGIYNIYEDFQQHSTIGYIDGGLDIAITGLSFLGPEAEPVVLALTIVRMGIDTFYNDIGAELKNLPSDATAGQKIGAVFKGIANAFEDLAEEFTITGQIFGAISRSRDLDEKYDKNQEFLKMLSDYHSYFSIVKEEGSGANEINFAGGSESWNGGDITFELGEYGQSTLTLEAVTRSGRPIVETHNIETNNVEDIVMGIGESHSISFKKQTVKAFWFIPVHSRSLISGQSGERDTLHGTYYGNSKNNNFIAVQSLPPNNGLEYNLHDYHYQLYGRGGDDTFYLGPQHSYVEGNDGSDTYFISTSTVYTRINNYADDDETDFMVLNLNFDQLTVQRSDLDLLLTSSNGHLIYVIDWFGGDSFQHMVFKTSDGILFKVSATVTVVGQVELVIYALNGAGASTSLVLDARGHDRSQVMTVIGSDYDDIIFGNELNNQINGGNGVDSIMGGNGKDTYTIDLNGGVDIIDNYATDGQIDTLIFAAKFDDINPFSQSDTNHLHLARVGSAGNQVTGSVITNWFLDEKYRHMILVSEDGIVVNISSTKTARVNLQPILADMSFIQEIPNAALYSRVLDLSNDPLLTEIVTIFGSPGNDHMIGNHKGNYMTGGKGFDRMEGRGGADVYVVKQGDGKKLIVNDALDGLVDTLLMDANFDDIELSLTDNNNDLVLAAYTYDVKKCVHVTLDDWFVAEKWQHLLVRTSDGVVFNLPTNYPLLKIARILDSSKKSTNAIVSLNEEKWNRVKRVIGSQGTDTITGNAVSNYFDPQPGSCSIQGNDGLDTYVIKPGYGTQNVINNFAEDGSPDTLLFSVPFLSINATTAGNDVQLTSNTGQGLVNAILKDYASNEKSRHLTIISSDGIQFVLPPGRDFQPVPLLINKAQAITGQHINLTALHNHDEVRTVYGASRHMNYIIGNDQSNTIVGGSESDYIHGLDGDDTIKGGDGSNTLDGGPGADTLVGGAGEDIFYGGEGDDIISPGLRVNLIDGGPGSDTVIYSGDVASEEGIDLNLARQMCIHERGIEDRLLAIENAFGTDYDDMLQGDDEDNVLVGRGGNDYLSPGAGYDILNGGNGKDTYNLAAADGTVTIENYATDGALDKVIMTYAKKVDFRYEKSGDNLIVHVINTQYPVFYDGTKPTVIFKGWFMDQNSESDLDLYNHAYIKASDGVVNLNALSKTTSDNFYTINELENNCGQRAINSGDTIALQIDNRRYYIGCTKGYCENVGCPGYEFTKEDREHCYCSVFEIYRMQGPGEVKVGDIVGIHYPHDPGTWVGCPNHDECGRSGCAGLPNIQHGFENEEKWDQCGGEVFQIYSMSDDRPVGEAIRANDKIGLFYVHGGKWLSFTGEGGKTRAWPCPDNSSGRPPPKSAFEICYGESFTLIDLQ